MYKKALQMFLLLLFPALFNAQTITKGEYFIDTDPGVGNGIVLTVTPGDSVNITPTISTSSLSAGFHRVYFRFFDSNGSWGHSEDRLFYVYETTPPPPLTLSPQLVSAEYFFDTDPGVGNGIPVASTIGDSLILLNQSVSSTGLSAGFHRLYFRAKDVNNKWSHYEDRLFFVYETTPPVAATVQPSVVAMEYYFDDTDPGVANGTAFPAFAAGDSVILNQSISVSSLALGNHKLNVRAKDLNGKWSHTESRAFSVQNCTITVTATTGGNDTLCQGETAIIQSSSTGTGLSYQWYKNNNLLNITTSTYSTNSVGSYQVVVTDGGGCANISNAVVISVNPNPTVSATASAFSVCPGNSVTLTGGGATTYSWSNNVSNGVSFVPVSTVTYTVTGTDLNSCSATSTVTVSAYPVPTVTVNTNILTANPAGATYKWIDCGNANTIIPNETSQSFTALSPGNYAAVVTQGSCVDTSACVAFTSVEIAKNTFSNQITIYPTPAQDFIMIEGDFQEMINLTLTDITGKKVLNRNENGLTRKYVINTEGLSNGIYLLKIQGASEQVIRKVNVSH